MSTGLKTFGSDTSSVYYYRTWNGADDPVNRRAWNAYTTYMVYRRSAGNRLYCNPWTNCNVCSPMEQHHLLADYWAIANSPFSDLLEEATTKAQNRLTSTIRDHSFDLGNYAVEGKQTVTMCLQALGRLRSGLRRVRRGDFGGAVRAAAGGDPRGNKGIIAKDVSSAHLGMIYGVLPLMGDIYESTEAWRAHGARKRTYRASATAKRTLTLGNYPDNDYDVTNTVSVRVGYDVVLSEDISTVTSLGLNDPLGIAWEGIPFSFVLDWFLPIGDYLDRMSILPKLAYSRAGMTVKIKQQSSHVQGSQKGPTACSQFSGGYKLPPGYTNEVTYIRFTRKAADFSASSIARPKFVGLDGLRGWRIANAVALAHQLLR